MQRILYFTNWSNFRTDGVVLDILIQVKDEDGRSKEFALGNRIGNCIEKKNCTLGRKREMMHARRFRAIARRYSTEAKAMRTLQKSQQGHLLRGIGSWAAAVSLVWSGRVSFSIMMDHTKRIKCMDGVSFSIMILIGLDGCCMCFIFTYGRPCLEANIQHRLTG